MLRLGSSVVLPQEPSSGLRSLRRVTTDRRRYTWHLRRTAIGRAVSRCGMGIGAFGRTLLSEFANNSPRGAFLNRPHPVVQRPQRSDVRFWHKADIRALLAWCCHSGLTPA